MVITFKYKIDEVKTSSYKINNDNRFVFINKEHSVDVYNETGDIEKIDLPLLPIAEFALAGNAWIGSKRDFNSYIYDAQNSKIKMVNYLAVFDKNVKYSKIGDFIFPKIYIGGKFDEPFYAKIDVTDFELKGKYDLNLGYSGIDLMSDENHFISKNNDHIGLFSLENQNIWSREFKEFLDTPTTECQRELIIYKNYLYFIVYSEGVIKCISLDIATGNLLKEYEGLYGEMILDGYFLYFLSSDDISVLNLETEELKTFSITNIFESSEIKRLLFPRWFVKDGIIYFTQSAAVDMHSGNTGAIFGALDIEQLKILWYETISKEHGIIGTIQVENERIYLHTQDQTLFIYEVEK